MGFVVIHNIDECSGQRQSNCHYAAVYIAGTGKKAKAHLVFYIPTGITNLIGGFLAYFGLMAFVGSFFQKIVESYGFYLFAAELIVGIALLIAGSFVVQNRKISAHAVASSHEEMEDFLCKTIDKLPGVLECTCNMILSRMKDIKGLRL